MRLDPKKRPVTLAVLAALGTMAAAPQFAHADRDGRDRDRGRQEGTYLAGDFHNHTTCSDGAVSMQKQVKKSMDRTAETPWGLDWFVQAGHGGTGNRNCTLGRGREPGHAGLSAGLRRRRQHAARPADDLGQRQPVGHAQGQPGRQRRHAEHVALGGGAELPVPADGVPGRVPQRAAVPRRRIGGGRSRAQLDERGHGPEPAEIYRRPLPSTAGYTPLGNANALAQWQYCFDRGNSDTSRGNTTTQPGNVNTGVGNNWDCSLPGSLNAANPDWLAAAAKLAGANGDAGHQKTVESVKWMAALHPESSYYVPAHLERAGPFNPVGNNGFNVEHLRNFNNAAPGVAFGFESQPGHGASDRRGEYNLRRNAIGGDTGRLGRRHHLRRHRRLRRADRRRVGRAAGRRPQLVVLRQLRLALARRLQRRRPPQRQRLLARRVPAQLHDGGARPHRQEACQPADGRRRTAQRQQLGDQRRADRPAGLRRLCGALQARPP